MTKIDRTSALQRSAHARANIIAFLNNADKPMSLQEIRAHIADTLKFDDHNIGVKINDLVSNKLIKKDGDLFYSNGSMIETTETNKSLTTPKVITETKVSKSPKVISIDVVKSTGKIRLSVQDLIVEIGIIG